MPQDDFFALSRMAAGAPEGETRARLWTSAIDAWTADAGEFALARAYFNRGAAHARMGLPVKARADSTSAIELDPFAKAYNNRRFLVEPGDRTARSPIRPRPRRAPPRLFYSRAFYTRIARAARGDYRRAIDDYSRAVAISTRYAKATTTGDTRAAVGESEPLPTMIAPSRSIRPSPVLQHRALRWSQNRPESDRRFFPRDSSRPTYATARRNRGIAHHLGGRTRRR
jgi:tetratricopeptide (TPR) repeat protein